jgi:flagellar biosynthesis GTPase FlhF
MDKTSMIQNMKIQIREMEEILEKFGKSEVEVKFPFTQLDEVRAMGEAWDESRLKQAPLSYRDAYAEGWASGIEWVKVQCRKGS